MQRIVPVPAGFAPSTLAVTSKVFCNPLIVEREVPALHMYVTYSKEYCRLYAYELQQPAFAFQLIVFPLCELSHGFAHARVHLRRRDQVHSGQPAFAGAALALTFLVAVRRHRYILFLSHATNSRS